MQQKQIYLSVIIPAYNEENRIAMTLFSVDKYLSEQDFSYEIIVVNDGSTDKTTIIVQNLMAAIKNLYLIDRSENLGKGITVNQGIMEAKGKLCLFMDADNSTQINQIEKLFPFIENGYEAVIGSRDTENSNILIKQPFYKVLFGKLGNLFVRALILPRIKDTQCGFKLFTNQSAKNIFSRLTINGFGFDMELLVIARILGYRIKEVGIDWENNFESKVKFKDYFKTLLEAIKIKYNIIKNIYV